MPKILPELYVTFHCSCLANIAKCLWNRILTRHRCILSIFGRKNARIALQGIRVYSEQRALHYVFCIFLCCIVYCVFWEWAGTETAALESRKMSQMCRSAMMQAFSPSSCFMRSYKIQIRCKRETAKISASRLRWFFAKVQKGNLTAVWCQYQFWPKVRAVLILLYDQSLEDPFQQSPLSLQTRQVQQKIKSSQILVF